PAMRRDAPVSPLRAAASREASRWPPLGQVSGVVLSPFPAVPPRLVADRGAGDAAHDTRGPPARDALVGPAGGSVDRRGRLPGCPLDGTGGATRLPPGGGMG